MVTMTEATIAPRPVESRNPATGEVWARYEPATAIEVRSAVKTAREAQIAWAARPAGERAAVMRRFRRLVAKRRDDVAGILARENGKPDAEGLMEVIGTADYAAFYAKEAVRSLSSVSYRPSNLGLWRKRVYLEHEPYGVIGAIAPWNFPFLMAAGIAVPALVSGNAVVLKPSEFTPASALLLAELLHQSGVPSDVLHVALGDGSTGAALIESDIDKIFFIGSEATGRKIVKRAGERMLPYVLELGGSDPAIVLEDADLEVAARGIAWGRFTNAGQTCVAPKRIFVVEPVYDAFVEAVSNAVKRLRVGREGDVGPLIRPSQVDRLDAQYRDALERGARVAARSEVSPSEGDFFPPTVLVDVDDAMKVMTEETFGPLLPIVKVRDENEAIERANATMFGLSGSVWSRDVGRARRVAQRLEAGTVTINDSVIVPAIANVPHGGVKSSGSGRMHGAVGLLEFVRTKAIVADPWPGWREVYWHEYSTRSAGGLDDVIEFLHGTGPLRRIRAGLSALWRLYLKRG